MARIIKRYDNRKLYDTEASSYVSQKDIAAMVRRGETVRVIDNTTGEDLTAQTLTQIILEEGKESGTLLPTDTLHGLLRRGGQALGQATEQVKSGLDELVQQSLSRLNRLARSPRSGEVEQLRDQLARVEEQLAQVLGRVEENGAEDKKAEDTKPEEGPSAVED